MKQYYDKNKYETDNEYLIMRQIEQEEEMENLRLLNEAYLWKKEKLEKEDSYDD